MRGGNLLNPYRSFGVGFYKMVLSFVSIEPFPTEIFWSFTAGRFNPRWRFLKEQARFVYQNFQCPFNTLERFEWWENRSAYSPIFFGDGFIFLGLRRPWFCKNGKNVPAMDALLFSLNLARWFVSAKKIKTLKCRTTAGVRLVWGLEQRPIPHYSKLRFFDQFAMHASQIKCTHCCTAFLI